MQKPHIWKSNGRWWCKSGMLSQSGCSPMDAYKSWEMMFFYCGWGCLAGFTGVSAGWRK